MTGRPGHRTMEMNGGSSAPYLARTPCVPSFSTLFNRGGNRRAFRLPGAGGGSFPLYGGTFARSYSVSSKTKGPGEKGAPRNDQKFRLSNWPISSADLPMTPNRQGRSTILSFFRRRILGQYPAAPCPRAPPWFYC